VNVITQLIRWLRVKSSPIDCLPTTLIKSLTELMASLLAIGILANVSFSHGVFPSRNKVGHVVPLIKKSGLEKDNPASYRPITKPIYLLQNTWDFDRLAVNCLQPHVLLL